MRWRRRFIMDKEEYPRHLTEVVATGWKIKSGAFLVQYWHYSYRCMASKDNDTKMVKQIFFRWSGLWTWRVMIGFWPWYSFHHYKSYWTFANFLVAFSGFELIVLLKNNNMGLGSGAFPSFLDCLSFFPGHFPKWILVFYCVFMGSPDPQFFIKIVTYWFSTCLSIWWLSKLFVCCLHKFSF